MLPGAALDAPLIDGCLAWLECRVIPEPHIQRTYDLFLGEVLAASADAGPPSRRSIPAMPHMPAALYPVAPRDAAARRGGK